MRGYAYWTGVLAACLAVCALLWPSRPGSDAERAAREQGRIILSYWDRHHGREHELHNVLIREFNESQDEIFVRTFSVGSRYEKLITAIATGAPPDVCSVDSIILASLAPQGCFMPLNDLVEKSPHLSEEAFLPHAWRFVNFDGNIYGIPKTIDSFALLWNKAAFRKAGLDPEKPPRTLEELTEFAGKLTIRTDKGIEQVGFLPWLPFPEMTYMWSGMFGHDPYDPVSGLVKTAGAAPFIDALRWIGSFSIDPDGVQLPHAISPDRFQGYGQMGGAYQSATNPFYSGKVAMITEGEWQVEFIRLYAPDLDWGVAPIPQPEGAPPRSYSPSCIVDVIPVGSKEPEAALKYLEWYYTPRPGGGTSPASDYCYAIHNVPPRREEALQARFTEDPKFRVFVDQLLNYPAVAWPVMPATTFLINTIEREREYVTFRRKTPEEAALAIEEQVNVELQRVREILKGSAS